MARPKKYKVSDIVDALQKAHGLKTGAAELLAASFTTVDKFCNKHAECQAVVDHWRKRRKDRAEYKLDEAIERGESWAIMFTLKNARDREYNDRLEIGGDPNAPLEVIVKYVTSDSGDSASLTPGAETNQA